MIHYSEGRKVLLLVFSPLDGMTWFRHATIPTSLSLPCIHSVRWDVHWFPYVMMLTRWTFDIVPLQPWWTFSPYPGGLFSWTFLTWGRGREAWVTGEGRNKLLYFFCLFFCCQYFFCASDSMREHQWWCHHPCCCWDRSVYSLFDFYIFILHFCTCVLLFTVPVMMMMMLNHSIPVVIVLPILTLQFCLIGHCCDCSVYVARHCSVMLNSVIVIIVKHLYTFLYTSLIRAGSHMVVWHFILAANFLLHLARIPYTCGVCIYSCITFSN